MTSINAMNYIDSVLAFLHLDPTKITEVSVELNETERKISVRDINGNIYLYEFSTPVSHSL
ncbi:MAG TPA: hypothetical protein VFI73_11120 [Candidatus Nitrosopolaris sp.]|nr:hypothetical protein [Candidatus Nitrosopolaris sp.]